MRNALCTVEHYRVFCQLHGQFYRIINVANFCFVRLHRELRAFVYDLFSRWPCATLNTFFILIELCANILFQEIMIFPAFISVICSTVFLSFSPRKWAGSRSIIPNWWSSECYRKTLTISKCNVVKISLQLISCKMLIFGIFSFTHFSSWQNSLYPFSRSSRMTAMLAWISQHRPSP